MDKLEQEALSQQDLQGCHATVDESQIAGEGWSRMDRWL